MLVLPYVLVNRKKEEIYKEYVSDSLRIIGRNTALMSRGEYMSYRFSDLFDDCEDIPTRQDIVDRISRNLHDIGVKD